MKGAILAIADDGMGWLVVKEGTGLTHVFFVAPQLLSSCCGCWFGHVSLVRLLKDPRVDLTLEDDSNGCSGIIAWFIASGKDFGDVKNMTGNFSGATKPQYVRKSL